MRTIPFTYFAGAIVMLGFLFNSASANAKNYPQLYENKASSENYEIVKLVDGPIDSVYSNNRTGEFITQSGSRLWKINAKGEVIDYLDPGTFYASGLILEKDGFSDWVFTGDKKIKPYEKTIDAKEFSEKKLFEFFDQAEAIEFVDQDDAKIGLAYLYKQGQVSVLDISNKRDQIDDFYFRQSVKKDHNLRREETDVIASRFGKYEQKNVQFTILPATRKDSLSNLQSIKFKKIATHRSMSIAETFIENTLGQIYSVGSRHDYGYDVGYTQYQLSHHNEQLNFSVFSDNEYDSVEAWNFQLVTDKANASNLVLMAVNYRRHYLAELNEKSLLPYYEQDVGLYVVRKKIPHNQFNAPQWQLGYSGLHSYDSIWGNIQFTQPELESVFYWFRQDRPIPAAADMDHFGRRANIASPILKVLPASLDFHWTASNRNKNFRLVINHKDAHFYQPEDTKIKIKLNFDANELNQAFNQFEKYPDTILLNMDLQERDYGGELVISVKNDKKKIILQNVQFDYEEIIYSPKSPNTPKNKAEADLFSAYESSLLSLNPDQFLQKINSLKDSKAIANHASAISYYFSQLSLTLNINKKLSENTTLFTQYFRIHPDIIRNPVDELQHKNLMVFASQGIYLASNTKNPELNHQVVNTFVEQNFNLEQETNRAFLFNLACYYAVNHNKAKMLRVINRSLELGRDPESYLKDGDFKDYWQDADFLKALQKTSRSN